MRGEVATVEGGFRCGLLQSEGVLFAFFFDPEGSGELGSLASLQGHRWLASGRGASPALARLGAGHCRRQMLLHFGEARGHYLIHGCTGLILWTVSFLLWIGGRGSRWLMIVVRSMQVKRVC